MRKLIFTLGIALVCAALSGCIVVPARPGGYYASGYVGGCYHCYR